MKKVIATLIAEDDELINVENHISQEMKHPTKLIPLVHIVRSEDGLSTHVVFFDRQMCKYEFPFRDAEFMLRVNLAPFLLKEK